MNTAALANMMNNSGSYKLWRHTTLLAGVILVHQDFLPLYCTDHFFINLTQTQVIWKEGTPIDKMPPSDCGVIKPMGPFLG